MQRCFPILYKLQPLCLVCTKQKTKLRLSVAVTAAFLVVVVAVVTAIVVVVDKFVCIENAFGPSCNELAKCSSK